MQERKTPIALVVFGIICAAAAVVSLIALMLVSMSDDVPADNTDPRIGEVYMGDDLYKVCDGTTLIYTKSVGGASTVENSPECS